MLSIGHLLHSRLFLAFLSSHSTLDIVCQGVLWQAQPTVNGPTQDACECDLALVLYAPLPTSSMFVIVEHVDAVVDALDLRHLAQWRAV